MKNKENIDSQTKEFIDLFVSESTDLLDDAESKLNRLDESYDSDVVDTIFRMFHSIKGSAGYFNFENIQAITHQAEALLDLFRKQKINADQDTVDVLYKACDFIRQLVDNVGHALSDQGYEDETGIMIGSIEECIKNIQGDIRDNKKEISEAVKEETVGEEEDLVSPELVGKFIEESKDILSNIEDDVLKYEKDPENKELINDAFRGIHTVKGNAGFLGLKEVEEKAVDIEVFFETLKYGKTKINGNVISFLLSQVDSIKSAVVNSTQVIGAGSVKDSGADGEYKPLGEILVDMGEATEKSIEDALDKQQRPLGEILVEEGMLSKQAVEKALQIQNKAGKGKNYGLDSGNRKDIRVATHKLDKLFELMGELVTAEVMVTRSPELEGLNMPEFSKSSNYLSKITRDLQEITMSIRMIPLEGIFNKMIRLVRDLSRKSGKNIKLNLSGQETEMDRNVIEEISDPLVHILRNAVDHGIEPAEEREKNKKSKNAVIMLNAKYEGSEIWITVKDDGRGLDRQKILKKALDKGLVDENSENLTDKEVWQIIFEAGFSTAKEVTDISGRGVGMDVVRRNIQKLRGKIDINSTKGESTEIILKIPLTMAIMDCITVKVGEGLYSIPTTDILEFFKAREEQITNTQAEKLVVKLRNEILPVIKLYEVFDVETKKKELMDGIMMVILRDGKKACLLIDEIVGSQQVVIKSLGEYFGRKNGISGCSVSGSGEVVLILDTNTLLNESLN